MGNLNDAGQHKSCRRSIAKKIRRSVDEVGVLRKKGGEEGELKRWEYYVARVVLPIHILILAA